MHPLSVNLRDYPACKAGVPRRCRYDFPEEVKRKVLLPESFARVPTAPTRLAPSAPRPNARSLPYAP